MAKRGVCVGFGPAKRLRMENLSLLFEQSMAWGDFVGDIQEFTEGSFKRAIKLQSELECNPGGLRVIGERQTLEALAKWSGTSKHFWASVRSRNETTEMIWYLLNVGGARKYINHYVSLQDADKSQYASIHMACATGSSRALELMLQDCPELNVNLPTLGGKESPLMICLRQPSLSLYCFQLLMQRRLHELDLGHKDAAGHDMIYKINQTATFGPDAMKIRAIWNTAVEWLHHSYYPRVCDYLKLTKILRPILAIIYSFFKPHNLALV
jgi:hypothetical protein